MISRLLIANRGEIACRIIRTARRMGIECIAVFSDADRQALHVQMADRSFHIGASAASESYLDMHKLLAVARQCQADAIHPGYGFLSENAEFARLVEQAGIRFVGPSAEAIEAMGSKSRAKALMKAAGVPLLPGYHGEDQDAGRLLQEADSTGYPLLIKAVAGGGGRGLRVVERREDFSAALSAVQRESQAAFGDQRVLLETYLPGARHIEVQIFADTQGNCVHLFERDCSIQRRHQKLIEEAPAPWLDETLRQQLYQAAVAAAREINYSGAGTVEFLYQDGAFHFMEMNTRLQVEHPVTEAITGVDLVEWQLRVASGEPLPLQQDEIQRKGWAIEARINAEDPAHDFLPGSGLLRQMHWPTLQDVRIDSGFRGGDTVSIHYDSLLAKLIVWAPDRPQATQRFLSALAHCHIEGVPHTTAFLRAVAASPLFLTGEHNTGFLSQHAEALQGELARLDFDAQLSARNPRGDRHTSRGVFEAWRSLGHNTFSRRFHLLREAAPGHEQVGGQQSGQQVQLAIKAPLPGKLIVLHVAEGEEVRKGDPLFVLEAMKMEHTVTASSDCRVARIHCQTGQFLQPEQLIMEFEEES